MKATNKGLLHHQSNFDARYKTLSPKNHVKQSYCLSSTPNLFVEECNTFKGILLKLKHPERLIDSIMTTFTESQNQQQIRDVKQMHLFGLFCHLKIKNQLTLEKDNYAILERE